MTSTFRPVDGDITLYRSAGLHLIGPLKIIFRSKRSSYPLFKSDKTETADSCEQEGD